MDFYELAKRVGEKLKDERSLEVIVKAKRDNQGAWSVEFSAKTGYDTLNAAPSPEGLLMKIAADKIPAVKIEDIGLISRASE